MTIVNSQTTKHDGQATVETLISVGTIMMFLPAIIAFFNYVEIQQWTDQVARYTAWERSVWEDPDAPWDLGEGVSASDRGVQRTDAEIARQAMLRVGLSRRQLMREGDDTEAQRVVTEQFPLQSFVRWSSDKETTSGSMFVDPPTPGSVVADLNMQNPDRTSRLRFITSSPDRSINLGLMTFGNVRTETSDTNTADVLIQANVRNLFSAGGLSSNPVDGEDVMGNNPLGESAGTDMAVTATAGLHTNPWSPQNEDVAQRKIQNLSVTQYTKVAAGIASLGLSSATDAALPDEMSAGPDGGFDRNALSSVLSVVPILGQIEQMTPTLESPTAFVPFNRLKIYAPGSNPHFNGDEDTFGEDSQIFTYEAE